MPQLRSPLAVLAVVVALGTAALACAPPPPPAAAPAPPAAPAPGTSTLPGRFVITDAVLRDVWVDPATGSDAASGATRTQALRTVAEAWRRIPASRNLTEGLRIQLAAGTYPPEVLPGYLEHRWGTAGAPIMVNSADGDGAARLTGDLNAFDVRHLYLVGLVVDPPGDAVHCERCDTFLLRRVHVDANGGQEAVKVNQSRNVYIEDSQIHDATDNAVDFVAVHGGHLLGNDIHHAGDWCAYAKGGSARIVVDQNHFHHCGTGGFTAGQGTGFEFMVAPWLRYEAVDMVVTNNLVRDTEGAALGVNGAANVLVAHNTAWRTGSRSHALEVVHGGRSCDGDTAACQANHDAGGWGAASVDGQFIPNVNVTFANNAVVNPPDAQSPWGQLSVHGPVTPPPGTNTPAPSRADDGLVVRGNLLANGDNSMPAVDGSGCTQAPCTAALIAANNTFTGPAGLLVAPDSGDLRPVGTSPLGTATGVALSPTWPEREPGTGTWSPPATWTHRFDGSPRTSSRPGAW